MRSLRLLVVDDSPVFTRIVARELEALGHHVEVENDSERAVKACRSEPYDVVFCDLVMPGLDGLDVLEQACGDREGTRFVLMSGHLDVDDVLAAHRAGAVEFLRKPFNKHDLANILDRVTTDMPGFEAAEPAVVAADATLLDRVKAGADGLPAPSRRLLGTVKMLTRTHPRVDAVEALLAEDNVVATAVVDRAFGGPGGPPSVKRGLESAGVVRVLTLAASLGLREAYEAASERLGHHSSLLWRVHCATSFVAEALAVRQRIGQPERVQLMVLLSHIGELATVLAALDQDPMLWRRDRPSTPLVEMVAETSAQASVAVLERWGLPKGLVRLAHGLVDNPNSPRGIVGLAASARRATLCGFGHYPFSPKGLDFNAAIPGAGGDLVRRLFHEASTIADRLDLP